MGCAGSQISKPMCDPGQGVSQRNAGSGTVDADRSEPSRAAPVSSTLSRTRPVLSSVNHPGFLDALFIRQIRPSSDADAKIG